MDLVEVYRAAQPFEAHTIVALLADAGIRSRVDGESLVGALGELPLGWQTSPRVLVTAQDAEAARNLLLEFAKSRGQLQEDDEESIDSEGSA